MSRPVRRRLAAALRTGPAGWLDTTAVLKLPPGDYPQWTPGGAYVEALTAAVWARRTSTGDAQAIVRTYGPSGEPVLTQGIVASEAVARLGGLTDKPHRITWLGRDLSTEPIDGTHPAARYSDWIYATATRLDDLYRTQLRRCFLLGQQVRLYALPHSGFQATVDIEIETGAYRRHDITAHAAGLSALLRHLGPGARLRFYAHGHPAADPLGVRAWRTFSA